MTEAKIAFILTIFIAPDIHEDASHKYISNFPSKTVNCVDSLEAPQQGWMQYIMDATDLGGYFLLMQWT